MTPTPQLFRRLMWTVLGLVGVSLVLTFGFPGLVPEPVRQADEYVQAQVSTPRMIVGVVVFVVCVIAAIVGFVGLYRFKPWARPLNVALAFSSFLVWPILGYNVSSGWAQAFIETAELLWGAILAMAYFSAVSAEFQSHER